MLDQLTHTDFERYLDTIFTLYTSEKDVFDARLIRVETIGRKPEDTRQRWAYSLIFHIPEKKRYLVQKVYQLTHPDMGNLDLFLVPLGPDESGVRYEAVFT